MANLKLTRVAVALGTAFLTVNLAACSSAESGRMAADGAVCQPFPKAATTTTTTPATAISPAAVANDPATAMDDCLHRWGYALAHSSDDATAVAQAVTAACNTTLAHWNQATLSTGPAGDPPAPSLVTGQPTTPFNEHVLFAQGRALFYVVQARAGRCAVPPMKDGVPTGLPN